ncbi:MAG: hypothetical protein A2Y10_16985 [Planctomycetes bacterium GWF2_41_51]|nr:MAG: hypothetical protein A2Y10_16985 [Planctomycetes bacterium GWF2_41_51]HBG28074.1 hypothetical protein [Phycisphaerales bacterium]
MTKIFQVKNPQNTADSFIVMIAIEKTKKWKILNRLFSTVKSKAVSAFQWYPSSRGTIGESTPNTKTIQLPPLMVRKAAWRK